MVAAAAAAAIVVMTAVDFFPFVHLLLGTSSQASGIYLVVLFCSRISDAMRVCVNTCVAIECLYK